MTWHGLKSTENQGKPKKEVVTEQWYQLLAGGRNNSQSMRVWTGTQQTLDVIRPAASSGWSKVTLLSIRS